MAGTSAWRESEEAVREVQRRQYGLASDQQVLATGLPRRRIRTVLGTGRWDRPWPGVIRDRSSPSSWHQALLGACLSAGPGAAASHRSAVGLWGAPNVAVSCVELTVDSARRPSVPGAILHRSSHLGPHVTIHEGIPVTSPARTLFDCCATTPAIVGRLARRWLADDKVRLVDLRAMAEEMSGRGRRGTLAFRRLLGSLTDVDGEADSTAEQELFALLAAHGLPAPELHARVELAPGDVVELDGAYRWCRGALELDGFWVHRERRVFEDDRRKQNALTLRGWRFLRITPTMLRRRPLAVVADVRSLLDGGARPAEVG